jgi:general secretion pathway protein C
LAFGPTYFQILKRGRGASPALGNWIVGGLALLCIILAANLFWVIAGPVGAIGSWKARAPLTIPAPGRIALYSSFDPFSRSAGVASGDVAVTSLSLTLFGTRVNEFSGSGSAILAGADGIQQSYAVGDEVLPGVILSSVMFDHVVLERGGVKESLFIDQSVPAENVGGGAPSVPPSAAAPVSGQDGEVKLNAATLRDSVSVAPRNEGGRVTGLVLTAKDDGSILRNAGLAPGDIVVTINGRPVGSPADIAAQLRPGAKLTLEVERGAQKIPVGLNLE